MNLLMLSGDTALARGQDGPFNQMLRRFSAYWTRIDIICPRAEGTEPRSMHGNVHVHPSPWHVGLQPYFIWRQGRQLLTERDYDLIISHDFGVFYNGIGAWLLARGRAVPYVSEIHHVEGYPLATTRHEQLYRRLARWYLRWVWRRAAAIRVVNHTEMPTLLRELGVPDEKILVLPSLYLDFDVLRPMPDVSKDYDVLFVGRLAPNKGIFTLLDALAQVKRAYPDVRLGILGSGPLRDAIVSRIDSLGLGQNVMLLSYMQDPQALARLYNQAKMLACASTSEGGPRVVVEAMACGTPVISTPVGVMRDIGENGTNCLLFEWDAGELAEKIRLLMGDDSLRERLAKHGRDAVQGFQADRIIEQYARSLQQLVEEAS